ncbi:MAG: zinc-ribbon domain-containing protein, partial [Chloroflexi bacterium]|nr:zinc-ribbon domain-containing protein [Chloroflexota bacterium]
MLCPQCNAENRAGARFCRRCGTKLTLLCSQCGAEVLPDAQFCDTCGAALTPSVAAPPAAQSTLERLLRQVPKEYAERLLATRGQPHDERRTVTILFSDIKGSTTMVGQLDPEEAKEIILGAFDFLIAPIFRYEGTLVQLMGDAILAFFGAPIAHEDDPERGCRAALEITAQARDYAEKLERERGIPGFAVRVGINTGLVVVGEVGSDLRVAYTAVGDAINLAARMEQNAEPGTVLITEATHKLIAPLFETLAMPPLQVKGKDQPLSTYRLLAARPATGKVRGIPGLESPLVGRQAEMAALREALERLQAGVGGIVTITGEAGLGKSRLVAEIRKLPHVIASDPSVVASDPSVVASSPSVIASEAKQSLPDASRDCFGEKMPRNDSPLQWVEGRCLSYGTSIAYLLWLDVLRGLLGVTAEDSLERVCDILRKRLQALCPDAAERHFPYLARLMSLPLDAETESRLRNLDGQELKSHTFEAAEALLRCAAQQQPLVLVCEDLHWADPTSLELLERLLVLTDRASLLFIIAFRPDPGHGSWPLRETVRRSYRHRHTDLELRPLSAADSQTLLGNLLKVEDLPAGLRQRIIAAAEGNPFFVEEVIRGLKDSGAICRDEGTGRWQATCEVADIVIPDTLQGALLARLDRLQEDTRRVLQMAAVIGRVFLYRLLEAIALEQRDLAGHLLTLQRQEMIRERARIPELEYIFKHELTREAAYNG